MDKPRQKKRIYNAEILNALVEKHGFTKMFIQQCLRGDRNSKTADTIRKEYAALNRPTTKKIEQFKKQ